MAYLNPIWLDEDEHTEYINDVSDISAYNTKIDREIERICLVKGVRVDEIPVDGSGYLTSRVLQAYAIEYAMYCIFKAYWGKRNGNQDIYYDKMLMSRQELKEQADQLTQQAILGLTDSNGDPKCSNGIASMVAI